MYAKRNYTNIVGIRFREYENQRCAFKFLMKDIAGLDSIQHLSEHLVFGLSNVIQLSYF